MLVVMCLSRMRTRMVTAVASAGRYTGMAHGPLLFRDLGCWGVGYALHGVHNCKLYSLNACGCRQRARRSHPFAGYGPTNCFCCRCGATPDDGLFYPCKCSGSIKYVHQQVSRCVSALFAASYTSVDVCLIALNLLLSLLLAPCFVLAVPYRLAISFR